MAPKPEIFGLHENADITCDQNESYDLFGTLLSLQPREQVQGKGMSQDNIIEASCLEIQASCPNVFDMVHVLQEYPTKYEESMNTVLTQECIRYNGLLSIMRISLQQLLKALKGLVVISNDLEMLKTSIFNNQVILSLKGVIIELELLHHVSIKYYYYYYHHFHFEVHLFIHDFKKLIYLA